jgi:hypothetical protein
VKEDDETREPHIETKIQVRNLKPVAGPGGYTSSQHTDQFTAEGVPNYMGPPQRPTQRREGDCRGFIGIALYSCIVYGDV